MDRILSMANGSSSSLFGCISTAIQGLIISQFPKDYFKYIHISTELPTRNMKRQFGTNTDTEFYKREKPYLIMQPTYTAADRSTPFQAIPLTSNFDNLQYRVDKRYLFEMIRDKKYGYNLKFKMNREKVEFDVSVTCSTLHQQLDIYRTILNTIVWERSFTNRIALETNIPKSIIGIIGKCCNMDIESKPEYIPILLKRLNSTSGYPITYKLRNASATDEWFLYYTHNTIVTFSDLEIESGEKKNMVDDKFVIRFRVSTEFNLPGTYFLDGKLGYFEGVDLTLKTKEYIEDNNTYIPLCTVNNLFSKYPPEMDGMQLYGTTIFQSDAKGTQIEDRIDLTSILDNDHIRVLRAHSSWNMNPDTLFKLFLLKDTEQVEAEGNYYIDYNTMELVLLHPDNKATYRIVTYFNYGTMNEILNNSLYKEVYGIDKLSDNSEVLSSLGKEGELVINPPSPSLFIDDTIKEGQIFRSGTKKEG